MDSSTVLGIAAVVAAFVFLDVLVVELRRCVREASRIGRRIGAYGELPIVSLAAAALVDLARLAESARQLTALMGAAGAALVALKIVRPRPGGSPLIP